MEPGRALGLATATDVSGLLRDLVGGDAVGRRGVLHLTSVWEAPGRAPRVLRIRPDTPRSRLDGFLLAAARAWADAIVTTGRILREEPELAHWPPGPPQMCPALEAWRRDAVGATKLPLLLVLTRRRSQESRHPAFGAGLPVDVFHEGSLREALAFLRRERSAERICVEVGPSTALSLYEEPVAVDELWLSRYLEPALPPHLAGGPFLSAERVKAVLPQVSPAAEAREESGRWSFQGLHR